MGKDADINMTNLKAATGINDFDESDHNPNGPGNETEMGDFLVYTLDGLKAGSDPMYDILIDCYSVNGLDKQGSYNSNDYYEFATTDTLVGDGDTISIQVNVGSTPGDYYLQQVATRPENWLVSTGSDVKVDNITYAQDPSSNSNDYLVIFECSVTGNGGVEVYLEYEDPLNTDLANYDKDFAFRLDPSEMEDPSFKLNVAANTIMTSGGFTVDYSASDGLTPYDWEIYRQPRDPNTGSTGSWIIQQSGTEYSDFSDSYTDTGVSTDTEYRYEIRCTDGGGTYEEDRTGFMQPTT